MAHSIILLRQMLLALMGNATEGIVADLLAAVNAAQDFLDNGDPTPSQAEQVHDKMHETEEWLAEGEGTTAGVVNKIETLTTELNALL